MSLFATTLSLTSAEDVAAGVNRGLGWLFWSLLVVLVLVAVLWLLRYFLRHLNLVPRAMEYVVLLVLLPKESMLEEQQRANKDWREVLAGFETMFLTLGSLKVREGSSLKHWWRSIWFASHEHMAFEIVAHRGRIEFYIAVPRSVRQLVEMQIQAQYPQAFIEEAEDYNLFSPNNHIRATMLKLSKQYFFPIRTYKKLDSDPLNAVTNVLSKVQPQEGAAIQILIRPKRPSWDHRGRVIARKMQEGKKIGEATSSVSGGFLLSSFRQNKDDMARGVPNITPMDQELIKSLEEKSGKPGFDVNIRLLTTSPLDRNAEVHLENMINAFSQFTAPESGNRFRRTTIASTGRIVSDFIYRHFNEGAKIILNSEEVNSLYHFPVPNTETPNIRWLESKQAPAPTNIPSEGIILGHNKYRGADTVIRMKDNDRRRHVYVIGTTGSGKTVLMKEMAKQDINNGHGVGIVDPHGEFVEEILEFIPPERMHDVILFDPSDHERPMGLNMLEAKTIEERDFVTQEMISIFYKLVSDPAMIGPMFEHYMRNAMFTLMEDEESPGTIADIPRIFTDKAFQTYKLTKVKDPMVRQFWEKEMTKVSDFHKSEMLGYLISKVGRFVENSMMRNIIGQPKSGFDFREAMDQKKILLVNLSKGKIGDINAFLLGLIIVSKLQMAALSRANVPEDQRHDFFLYIDEFQNFITDSISIILSEARKYRLNLTMAHQYMTQLLLANNDTKVRDAVLGNVGTMVAFRIGVEDAEILEKQFLPTFNAFDLVNQRQYTANVRLLIDNTQAKPFHMQAYPPTKGHSTVAQAVKQYSRLRYGKDRKLVEAEIMARTKLGEPAAVTPLPSEPTR